MKYLKTFESDSNITQDNINGMGGVKSPTIGQVPGQVNQLPSQQIPTIEKVDDEQKDKEKVKENRILRYADFIYEDGDGGGGVAMSSMSNCNGMGNVSSPTVAMSVADSNAGSGDVVANSIKYATNIPRKKKRNLKKIK